MTARARHLLAALKDGCSTRNQIFAHQGRFSLLNNGAAELRAAVISVACELKDGDYVYSLADGALSGPTCVATTPPVDPPATANTGWPAERTVEQEDEQLSMVVAA